MKEHARILEKAGAYCCFPSLWSLPDGRLMAAVTERERPSHSSMGITRLFLSSDGGKSWEETADTSLSPLWPGATGKFRTVMADGAWLDVGAGGMGGHFDAPELRSVTERDTWIGRGYHTVDHETDPSLFYLSGRDLHVGISADAGASWQRRSLTVAEGMAVVSGFRGCLLRDGTILFPVGGTPLVGGGTAVGSGWRQFMARSEDHGRSWNFLPVYEDSSGAFTEELSLLELDDGRILGMARAHRPRDPITGYLWQLWSEDGGRTWSRPVETRIWGYPCFLNHLRDGRLLCTYGYRREPMGIRAVLSDDGGHSWNTDDVRILRADGGTPAQGWTEEERAGFGAKVGRADLGYPWSVELDGETILTVYYITGADGVTHAAATRWSRGDAE